MRTLIILLITLFVSHLFAEEKPILEVHFKNRFKEEFTQIYKLKNNYSCKTELIPIYEIDHSPFSTETLEAAKKNALKNKSNCKEKIIIIDYQTSKIPFVGCSDNPSFKKLISELDQNCGRN